MAEIVVNGWVFPDPDALGVITRKTPNFAEARFRISDIPEDEIHPVNWQPPARYNASNELHLLNLYDIVVSGTWGKVTRVQAPYVFVKYDDGDGIFKWNPDNNNSVSNNNGSNNGSNNTFSNNGSNTTFSNNGSNTTFSNNGSNNTFSNNGGNNNPTNLRRNNNNANGNNNRSAVVAGGRRKTRKPRKGRKGSKGKKSRRGKN